MKRFLSLFLLVGTVTLASGCYFTGGHGPLDRGEHAEFTASAALDQLPGIAASVTGIVNSIPAVEPKTKKAVAGWGASVASFAADMKAGLASPDQLAGAYTALRNTVTNLPLDPSVQKTITGYVAWGDVAAQVLGLAVKVYKGVTTSENPLDQSRWGAKTSAPPSEKAGCIGCHSQSGAGSGFTSPPTQRG